MCVEVPIKNEASTKDKFNNSDKNVNDDDPYKKKIVGIAPDLGVWKKTSILPH